MTIIMMAYQLTQFVQIAKCGIGTDCIKSWSSGDQRRLSIDQQIDDITTDVSMQAESLLKRCIAWHHESQIKDLDWPEMRFHSLEVKK